MHTSTAGLPINLRFLYRGGIDMIMTTGFITVAAWLASSRSALSAPFGCWLLSGSTGDVTHAEPFYWKCGATGRLLQHFSQPTHLHRSLRRRETFLHQLSADSCSQNHQSNESTAAVGRQLIIITGPPDGPALFCSLVSVVCRRRL